MKKAFIIISCLVSSLMLVSCYEIGERTIVGLYTEVRCPFADSDEPEFLKGAISVTKGEYYILKNFYSTEVHLEHYFEDTLYMQTFIHDDMVQGGNIPIFIGDTLMMNGMVTKRTYNRDKDDRGSFRRGDYFFNNCHNIKIIGRGEKYYEIINREIERQNINI